MEPTSGRSELLTLTDGANRFLHALRDLGYMDGRLEAEVLDRAMAELEGDVDFVAIRRLVAEAAFEHGNAGLLEFLDEEWKLVFH